MAAQLGLLRGHAPPVDLVHFVETGHFWRLGGGSIFRLLSRIPSCRTLGGYGLAVALWRAAGMSWRGSLSGRDRVPGLLRLRQSAARLRR